jgi:hypothetical protein
VINGAPAPGASLPGAYSWRSATPGSSDEAR